MKPIQARSTALLALALAISGAFAASGALAQSDPASLTPPPPPSAGTAVPTPPDARAPLPAPGPRARPIAPRRDAGAQTTVNGRVARLLPNPNGEVDGLLLDDGTQVTLPPHLSSQLLATVKPRDSVAITGLRAPNAQVIHATEIRNTATSGKVVDAGPDNALRPLPRDPAALTSMNVNGRISTLLHTDRGDVNGVVLDNGTSVRFPPHVGTRFTGLLKTGGTLYAQGYGTTNGQGSALEATRLGSTRDAQQAVFAPPGGPAGERPAPPLDAPQASPAPALPAPALPAPADIAR